MSKGTRITKRWIDADGIMRACYDSFVKTNNKAYKEIALLVEAVPAADVAEVRHGRWVKGDEMADYPRIPYKPWETYCSCCGEIKEQNHDDFCGNCGAKMDEVEE